MQSDWLKLVMWLSTANQSAKIVYDIGSKLSCRWNLLFTITKVVPYRTKTFPVDGARHAKTLDLLRHLTNNKKLFLMQEPWSCGYESRLGGCASNLIFNFLHLFVVNIVLSVERTKSKSKRGWKWPIFKANTFMLKEKPTTMRPFLSFTRKSKFSF